MLVLCIDYVVFSCEAKMHEKIEMYTGLVNKLSTEVLLLFIVMAE